MISVVSNGSKNLRVVADLLVGMAERIPTWVYALMMRGAIFMVFWQSARQKVDGLLTLKPATFYLFRYEYALPLIPSDLAAYLATYCEHLFSVLILIGLATRLSAAALLVMTLVIQVFVYPTGWPLHLMWASILVYLVARGAGTLSADRLICNRLP